MHQLKPDHNVDRNTFRKRAPAGSRHLKVQLCKSIMESNRIFSLLFDKVFDELSANPWVDGFEKVRNLGSREFNILRLEDLCKNKGEARVISGTGQCTERTSKAMSWSCWKTHLADLKTWSIYSSPNFWRYVTVGCSFSRMSFSF